MKNKIPFYHILHPYFICEICHRHARITEGGQGDTSPPPLQNSNYFKEHYKITKICLIPTPPPGKPPWKNFLDPHLHRSWQFYKFVVNKYMLTILAKITGSFFRFLINKFYLQQINRIVDSCGYGIVNILSCIFIIEPLCHCALNKIYLPHSCIKVVGHFKCLQSAVKNERQNLFSNFPQTKLSDYRSLFSKLWYFTYH